MTQAKHSRAVADRPLKAKRAGKAVAARKLLEYLPAIYQETNEGEESTFVGRLLTPFEIVLLGGGEEDASQLEEVARVQEKLAKAREEAWKAETPEQKAQSLADLRTKAKGLIEKIRQALAEPKNRKMLKADPKAKAEIEAKLRDLDQQYGDAVKSAENIGGDPDLQDRARKDFDDVCTEAEILDGEVSEKLTKSLEEEIAALPELFDPGETPEEFLPWLASWAALSFRPELDETRRRRLLARIIQLYRIRGTRKYLEDLLQLCVDASVSVNDAEIPGFQLEKHSTVGVDAYIGGGPPHFFSVTLVAPKLSWAEKEKQIAIARSIIELAKPAHTFYELSADFPQFEIGVHSRVGIDTALGAPGVMGRAYGEEASERIRQGK